MTTLTYRFMDILFSILGLICTIPLIFLIIIMGFFDTGSPMFLQKRVGKKQKPFTLIKFRTMAVDTKSVASHLANPHAVTSLGRFLRKTKLDEIPQLWNVLKGEMSLVGPRPCLFSQQELIKERQIRGVFEVRPGITGLAQVNGIDMSTPILLADTDSEMIRSQTIVVYFKVIFQTFIGKGGGDRIKKKED